MTNNEHPWIQESREMLEYLLREEDRQRKQWREFQRLLNLGTRRTEREK